MTNIRPYSKRQRIVDEALLAKLRGTPCECCGRPGIAHHVKTVGSGGPDLIENLYVLCVQHHNLIHGMSHKKFIEKFIQFKTWLVQNGWEEKPFSENWFRSFPSPS